MPRWNPGPARRRPTQVLSATCGSFHVVILQEVSDHAPHVTDQFHCSTKTLFSPTPSPLQAQGLLLCAACFGARPAADSPSVTFCSVHIHNKVAKKRDAATPLLRRLHAHMVRDEVDFIGRDFNMSTFSTTGDVLSRTTSFQLPVTPTLGEH